jgi:hypothetical protein
MLIDRGLDLRCSAKGMHDTGKQPFDDHVAQDEVVAPVCPNGKKALRTMRSTQS